jgi:hypothetical protein
MDLLLSCKNLAAPISARKGQLFGHPSAIFSSGLAQYELKNEP